ncbi:MAG: lipoyl synthase, partial [Verrucomicrobiota bacterium]
MSGCGTKLELDSSLHREKKPPWIKVKLPSDPQFWSTKSLVTDLKLVTVCEEAQCPNRWECWSH